MSEQPTILGQVRPVRGCAELAVVAWHRSWQFTGLFRRSTAASMAASRGWTWQWAVVAWQACAQYPTHLITAGAAAAEIWTAAGSGSARVHRIDRRRRFTAAGLLLAVCAALMCAAVLLAVVVLALVTGAVLLPVLLLGVWLVGLAANLLRSKPEGIGRLGRRAGQLTDGPAVVLTDVVAGQQHRGDGRRLMGSLQDRWTSEQIAVAVLYAGSDDLVTYYRDIVGGWALDEGCARRMIWAGEKR